MRRPTWPFLILWNAVIVLLFFGVPDNYRSGVITLGFAGVVAYVFSTRRPPRDPGGQ